jgi:hypothetical protein
MRRSTADSTGSQGRLEIVAAGGADCRSAENADRPLNQSREAHRSARSCAVGQCAFAAALAQHQQHVQVLVEVDECAAHQLVLAGAGVEQEHDQRGVSAGVEALAVACLEQPAQPV